MERPVAIAFQGGGARLIGLIAAAHAISELERSHNINVRAISGSSAGAIAASLLAANVNFDQVRNSIRQIEPIIKKNFPSISNRALYYRFLKFLITGKTIYSYNNLKQVVELILSRSDIDPRVKISDLNLQKNLFLMYSDIHSYAAEPANESEVLSEAIVRSCALPIAFSSHIKGSGQLVDGGILDNLPTDVLMKAQTEPYPVFAIGFKQEHSSPAKSPWHYLYSLATSGVQFRILASKKAIGEDMALDLETSLTTLDFDKIVSVGIDQEYSQIKEQTRQFFQAYLSGHGQYQDPLSETKGQAPLLKLKSVQKSVYDYVFDSIKRVECVNRYLKMRVNAFSLRNPSSYDEIYTEQLIEFPEKDYIKGLILYMTNGAGYTASVECHAYIGGPEGKEIPCEQIVINDANSEVSKIGINTNLVVVLFKGDLRPLIGKSIYIIKKETRYGFMLDLRDKRHDFVALRSLYWPAHEIAIALNVPKGYSQITEEWLREGDTGPEPEEIAPIHSVVPAGYKCYTRALQDVNPGTRLKGNFHWDSPHSDDKVAKKQAELFKNDESFSKL